MSEPSEAAMEAWQATLKTCRFLRTEPTERDLLRTLEAFAAQAVAQERMAMHEKVKRVAALWESCPITDALEEWLSQRMADTEGEAAP